MIDWIQVRTDKRMKLISKPDHIDINGIKIWRQLICQLQVLTVKYKMTKIKFNSEHDPTLIIGSFVIILLILYMLYNSYIQNDPILNDFIGINK
jgi:hypothetical protein